MFLTSIILGFITWFLLRCLVSGFYTVGQNERAVKTSFGRAERIGGTTGTNGISGDLSAEEKKRYDYPLVRVIPPGGPYFKWPWQQIFKANIATQTIDMAFDPETASRGNGVRRKAEPILTREIDAVAILTQISRNLSSWRNKSVTVGSPTIDKYVQGSQRRTILETVTKDQLNTGFEGQIRWNVSEKNLYSYFFGIKDPMIHVLGYFVSVLRERVAKYEAPANARVANEKYSGGDDDDSHTLATAVTGISINDLRKNLSSINDDMVRECSDSEARYGIQLDASLITGIDPPTEVENALSAINTAYNEVSSRISLAQASADQKVVQSKKAVEIETLKASAEVQPLVALAQQLLALKESGPLALTAYVRNVKLKLFGGAKNAVITQ